MKAPRVFRRSRTDQRLEVLDEMRLVGITKLSIANRDQLMRSAIGGAGDRLV